MELLIAYFLEKGGVFGLLFLTSLAYIWWTSKKHKEDLDFLKEQNESKILEQKFDPKTDEILKKIENIQKELSVGSESQLAYQKSSEHIGSLIKDLWEWHSVKDADGVPVWYFKKSFETSIQILSENIKNDTHKLALYSEELSKLNQGRIDELKEVLSNYNKTIIDLTIALEKLKISLNKYGDYSDKR